MQLSSYIVAVLAKCIAMYVIFICYFNLGGSFGTHDQPANEYCFALSNAFPHSDRNNYEHCSSGSMAIFIQLQ